MNKPIKYIYFIPGTMCDERLWTSTWQLLRPHLTDNVELIHLPIPSLPTIDEIANCLQEQICENSYLVGFSLGGYLASCIAIQYPIKVSKLLLVSNMSSCLPDKETKERKRTIQWINANGYKGIPNKRINHLIHPNAHQNTSIKNLIKTMDIALGKEVLVHQLNVTTQRQHLLPLLFKLPLPINFLMGDTDKLVDFNLVKLAYKNAITHDKASSANKTINVLSETGHMLPLEQPSQLANMIKTWLIETNNES